MAQTDSRHAVLDEHSVLLVVRVPSPRQGLQLECTMAANSRDYEWMVGRCIDGRLSIEIVRRPRIHSFHGQARLDAHSVLGHPSILARMCDVAVVC